MAGLRTVLLCLAVGSAFAGDTDSDRDGLSDQFEQALLERFAPRFHISAGDCDLAPAEFLADSPDPRVKARNATIYGQVFPVTRHVGAGSFVEIHFYHLWAQDCGMNGHALDVESVYALVRADSNELPPHAWFAEFWLAAAHETTLCDVTNGARATALTAVDRGPDVWVSRGKHASFLGEKLCSKGCGRDKCDGAQLMRISALVNLGEPGAPMNGAAWSQSTAWPLASKMLPRYTSALMADLPAGAEVGLVSARDVVRGGRSTIKVAARTYGWLVAANTRTEEFLLAGATGAAAGVVAARNSAGKAGRGLKAASAATGKWLRGAFGAAAAQPSRPPHLRVLDARDTAHQ
jgi:hypothetical protein